MKYKIIKSIDGNDKVIYSCKYKWWNILWFNDCYSKGDFHEYQLKEWDTLIQVNNYIKDILEEANKNEKLRHRIKQKEYPINSYISKIPDHIPEEQHEDYLDKFYEKNK